MKIKKLLPFIFIIVLLIILIISILKIFQNNKKNDDFSFNFKEHGSFLVPVQIKGEKFLFLLDTRTHVSFIDNKLANKFSTPISDKDDYGNFEIKPIKLIIGNNDISPTTLISHDFAELRKMSGENIQGVIGLDMVRRFNWGIDLKNHQITLSKNVIKTNGQQCIKLEDDGYMFLIEIVHATKEGMSSPNGIVHNIWFSLGTGSFYNNISKEAVDFFRSVKSTEEYAFNKENPTIKLIAKNKIVTFNDSISDIHNMHLPIKTDNEHLENEHLEPVILPDLNIDTNNVLGKSFINQFAFVSIDPYNMELCVVKNKYQKSLKPVRQINIISSNDLKQIIIDYNNAKYLNKLGLQNKDEIISVNSKKYDVGDLGKVRHLLRYEHKIKLKIKRNNKIINVNL